MKKIKSFKSFKINELFDNEILKAKLEIPYLQGKLLNSFTGVVGNVEDKFADKLLICCPFIQEFKYQNHGVMFNMGFDKTIGRVFVYYYIEIRLGKKDQYICNVYARCVGEGIAIYEEKAYSSILDFNELVKFINSKGYKLLMDLNNWIKKNFKTTGTNHLSRKDNPVIKKLN